MAGQNATGAQPGMMNNLVNEMLAAGRLAFDSRVPLTLKLMLPMAAVLYWLWPIDLLPGLPFDDIAVLVVALHFFVKMAEEGLNKAAGNPAPDATAAEGQVVDTTWKRVE